MKKSVAFTIFGITLCVILLIICFFQVLLVWLSLNFPSKPKPFDNYILDIFATQGVTDATLIVHNNEQGDFHFKLSSNLAQELLKSFIPIKKIYEKRTLNSKIEYTFSFQLGKEPTIIEITVEDDHLLYLDDNYIYEGGNPVLFLDIISTVYHYDSDCPTPVPPPKNEEPNGQTDQN